METGMTDTWLDRLRVEHEELYCRKRKLQDFINGQYGTPTVTPYALSLLMAQVKLMRAYEEILFERIEEAEAAP
jgi:hypothetical protein